MVKCWTFVSVWARIYDSLLDQFRTPPFRNSVYGPVLTYLFSNLNYLHVILEKLYVTRSFYTPAAYICVEYQLVSWFS